MHQKTENREENKTVEYPEEKNHGNNYQNTRRTYGNTDDGGI